MEFEAAIEAVQALQQASDLDVADAIMQRYLLRHGFQYWTCVTYARPDTAPPGSVFRIHFPEPYQRRYLERDYVTVDPVLQHAARSTLPFTWRQLRDSMELSDKQRALFDDAAAAGLAHGITIPAHIMGRRPSSVNIAGMRPDIECDQEAMSALHLVAIYYHAALVRLTEDEHPPARLARREREYLSWVALGKSDWAIGRILGVSERSVAKGIERAKLKLGAENRAQAVAIALSLNLIESEH